MRPPQLAAQCHEECITLYNASGQVVGHGCVWNMDMFTNCLATAAVCFTGGCSGAFVTDANGVVLAEADICRDKMTLRPVRRVEENGDGGVVALAPPRAPARARTTRSTSE
jgi:hypothetical protein